MKGLWRRISGVFFVLQRPLPGWLTLCLLFGGIALAAVPVINASLNVPTGGTIVDNNATINTCVGVNGSKQFVYGTNCSSSGGGDTITTPNSTLTVGGTSSATTLDLNLAHSNAWTALLSNSAQIQAVGAGGANACAGTNYPTTAYGYCGGANNGATNIVGLVIGPQRTDFACTATCTAGDSARLAFFDSTTSGAGGRECDFWKVQASASLESSCGLIAGGSTGVQTSILRNQVSNDWNGTCASVAAGPHCVTASRSGQTESGLTCFQLDVTNHALAIDTGVTLSNAAAYTFTSTIPNGFVGSTSTASATSDTVTWFCLKP